MLTPRQRGHGMRAWQYGHGTGSRCRRNTLTTHKSGFSLFFHLQCRFSCRRKRSGCSKTSEIAGPAAKSVATVSVDSWYLALPPACIPRRVPARAGPSRPLFKDEHALQRTIRGQTASLSGSLSRDGTVGFICHHACPPRHQRLFYGLCTYIKSGSLPEGLFPPGPAHSPPSSYTSVSGVRNRVRISWRYRMATGSRSIRN